MYSLSSISTRPSSFGEPRIVERSRGTAHPRSVVSTRDRVARSLMLRPEAVSPGYVRR